jgi:hypothetical protein
MKECSILRSKAATHGLVWKNHAIWQDTVFDLPLAGPVLGCDDINIGLIGPAELKTRGFQFQGSRQSTTVNDWAPLKTTFIEWTPAMSIYSPVDTGRRLHAALQVRTSISFQNSSTYALVLNMFIV